MSEKKIRLEFDADTWSWDYIGAFLKKGSGFEGFGEGTPYVWLKYVLDQIEAQTKPPLAEPGWGVIVEAGVKEHDERLRWVAVASGHWSCENGDEYSRLWSDLIDPKVV